MLIFLVNCWSKKIIIIRLERHCILVHLHPLPTSGLALLASLNGTPRPIHGPPILALQRYAKLTSVVTRTNTQTSLDSTGLAMSMVVPFSEPEWSWRGLLADLLGGLLVEKNHHRAWETLYPRPSGLSPDFWTCTPCVSHRHTSPNPWPANRLPAKICKIHKCCHENKQPKKLWFYSFGNKYGCPLPQAWMVLTSLLADLLGGLLVEKILSSSGSRDTVFLSTCTLSRLLDLLSWRLLMAHLAQSMALQSSLYKDMQNSQVLSREQTPKQALILQVWQWVWLSPSPSLNGPDEPLNADLLGELPVEKNHHHQAWETLHPRPSAPSPNF